MSVQKQRGGDRTRGLFLEGVDPYRHLRAASAWGPAERDWKHPDLDIAGMHGYLRPTWGALSRDGAAAVLDRVGMLRRSDPGKPVLLDEFGLADDKWRLSPYMKEDAELVHFHNILWASALSGSAGAAIFWWWEELDRRGAYRHYRPLSRFMEDLPLDDGETRDASVAVEDSSLRAIGLQGRDLSIFSRCVTSIR